MRRLKALRGKLFGAKVTKVACIGGGPGSEIVGIFRYLRSVEAGSIGNEVRIKIFDKETSWLKVCKQLTACMESGWNIKYSFVEFDGTDPSTYSTIDFSQFDLVISSFFLSETRKLGISTAARAFWKYLIAGLKPGSIFLIIDYADNNGAAWAYIDSVKTGRPLSDLIADQSTSMSCPDSKACLSGLEVELDHRPKKNGTNLVRVMEAQ